MCFKISDRPKYNKKLIAKRNIPCYKIVNSTSSSTCFDSLFKLGTYTLNSIAVATHSDGTPVLDFNVTWSVFTEDCRSNRIFEGIHSFSNKTEPTKLLKRLLARHSRVILVCYIPKGVGYYYNPDEHEYVSLSVVPVKVST